MIAMEISSFGEPEVLRPAERPKPKPGLGEVLIRVEAAGISRADAMQRQGKYPPPPGASDIPGLEVAGVVEAAGTGAADWPTGGRVCAIVSGGGYAEYCTAPQEQVLPIPDGWGMQEAATLPENLFTVYDNLVTRAGLRAGETVLIHGGTSGIGSMAIMLSRALRATPFATAGTHEKCQACLRFGAEIAIDYKESDFVAEIKRITEGRGVDVILDLVGGPYLERNLEALATEGRLTIVSTQGGRGAHIDLAALMKKRARVMGSTMRARTPAQKGEVRDRLLREVWPILPAKRPISPAIDRVFPLRDASAAHKRLESGQHIGKIVLAV